MRRHNRLLESLRRPLLHSFVASVHLGLIFDVPGFPMDLKDRLPVLEVCNGVEGGL